MGLTAPERETVITFNDADDSAHVYTAQRTVITKLTRNPSARLLEDGVFEGSPWAEFELPKAHISFLTKRRSLTPAERTRRGEQLAAVRSNGSRQVVAR